MDEENQTPVEETGTETQDHEEQSAYDQNVTRALTYVKNILGITGSSEDDKLTIMIKATNAQIKTMTGIDLLNVENSIVEYHDGAGEREIFLKTQAQSITSIKYLAEQRQDNTNRQTIPTKYYVLKKRSVVFARPIFRGFQNIEITLKPLFTNFAEIPADYENLKLALALIVGNIRATSKQSGISSESVSGTTIVFDKSTITKDVQILLDEFITFSI